jgi:SNF2 family DNA or RNA helicase
MAKLSKVVGNQIILDSPYDPMLHGAIKSIPDYRWNRETKQWSYPATRFHAQRVLDTLTDFSHDGRVKALANPPKPFSLQRDKLYEFQSEGVDFLHRSKGRALLGDAPGLGKTVQVLWWLTETPDVQKVLVVAPTSVLGKWEDEIHKWAPGYSAAIIRTSAERLPKTKIHLMSYAIMTRRSHELQGYDLMILDEAHYIKDSKSARGKAANVIHSPRVIMMSGTPFLNRPIELWNLLTILAPAAYRNWKQFVTRYCDGHPVSIGHNRTVMDTSGASNTRELADRLSDVMIRRTKAEVLTQLPELQRTYMRVDVDSHEITNAVASLRQSLLNNVSYSNVITQLSKLRYTVGMSKVPWVIEAATELMAQSEDSKLVIYCHHLDVVSEIRRALLKYGVLTIQGSVSQQERADVQYKFQHGKQSRIMIITSAGGEGIDLFAADTIIFAEREWTPAGEEQAEARLHRIGQKAAVQSIYMVANGTIDEQISALVEKKREVFHEIIGSDVLHTQVIDTNIVADLLRLVREGK